MILHNDNLAQLPERVALKSGTDGSIGAEYSADSQKMTFDGKNYREDLFVSDRIHLNHEGQLKCCEEYIRPMIEKLIKQEGYADLIEE